MDMSDQVRPSPWHAGERALQERVGVAAQMDQAGRRVIRPFMPDQHREFFAQLPFLLVGSVDAQGWPWASILSGSPGFAVSPDPQRLDIAAWPVAGDPLRNAIHPGASLGVLGIELPTRRRNRMNGHVLAMTDGGFSLAVDQSFGNCAKYIQARDYISAGADWSPHTVTAAPFTSLDARARQLIATADTFFVASSASIIDQETGQGRQQAVDVSHRGGRSGFLKIDAEGRVVVPDYAGNRFFNTLGNLLVNSRAGLVFIDFDRGDLLQVVGTTEIDFDSPEVAAMPGVERLWRFRPSHGQWLQGALPQRFAFREISPASLTAGIWSDARLPG